MHGVGLAGVFHHLPMGAVDEPANGPDSSAPSSRLSDVEVRRIARAIVRAVGRPPEGDHTRSIISVMQELSTDEEDRVIAEIERIQTR